MSRSVQQLLSKGFLGNLMEGIQAQQIRNLKDISCPLSYSSLASSALHSGVGSLRTSVVEGRMMSSSVRLGLAGSTLAPSSLARGALQGSKLVAGPFNPAAQLLKRMSSSLTTTKAKRLYLPKGADRNRYFNPERIQGVADLSRREVWMLLPYLVITLWLGIFPSWFMEFFENQDTFLVCLQSARRLIDEPPS